ncbi:hypothetical protein THRCLA_20493 [Thraustotheca clavata]|uniref:Uncharacterized protein n=1 Tax=Thraustotheca clavata TaxID=74557 RepID=A0A1W0A6L1_9STRA|nr:hypothetical protein THRCLA_20493 [Thraustotheca clavata]
MGNSSSVLETVTSFADINDIKKALQESPDASSIDVIKAFHACCYLSTTCQRLQCILELFLKHGVDINAIDPENHWTILHHVFVAQKTFVLPYLLDKGAIIKRGLSGLAPHDYIPKSKHDHYIRQYLEKMNQQLVENKQVEDETQCDIQIVHDWKRDTHELGELLHVKCNGSPGYVQLIYHENDSTEGYLEEAIFDQFIQVENEKSISFSTAHLPANAIVHVLYVACDKHMMHRQVKAADGPLRIRANVEKYIFKVNGEAFHHANPVLDGMVFPTMREFQQFMKMMKSDKIVGVKYNEEEESSNQTEDSKELQINENTIIEKFDHQVGSDDPLLGENTSNQLDVDV